MKKFFNEFKEFATKGSVIDLAVGIMIGTAFNGVVNALVKDIITPPISIVLNSVNFSTLFLSLNGVSYPTLAAAQTAGAPILQYGDFLNTFISFIIIAFVIFLVIKHITYWRNRGTTKKVSPPATTKICPQCCTSIPLEAHRCPNCTSQLDSA